MKSICGIDCTNCELRSTCNGRSDRCYGIAADEKYLMVSEYGAYGSDAEVIVFKRWN